MKAKPLRKKPTIRERQKIADTDGWTLIRAGEPELENQAMPDYETILRLPAKKDFIRRVIWVELDHFKYLIKAME